MIIVFDIFGQIKYTVPKGAISMKTQTYYHTPTESSANRCDLTHPLYVNCAGTVCMDGGIDTRQVRYDFYLFYMLEGKLQLWLQGEPTSIRAGEMIVISPQTPYQYTAPKKMNITYLWVHFTGYEAESFMKNLEISTNRPQTAGIHWELYPIWKKLFHEFILNDRLFVHAAGGILTELLVEFSRILHNPNSGRLLLKSISYIHEHYPDDLKLSALAQLEALSETHYRALFKQRTGLSPIQYIIQVRVDAAANFLTNSRKSIHEIAALVGYADVYYFGRIFKSKTGISPGKYRRIANAEEA